MSDSVRTLGRMGDLGHFRFRPASRTSKRNRQCCCGTGDSASNRDGPDYGVGVVAGALVVGSAGAAGGISTVSIR